jgi:hypothetical protein
MQVPNITILSLVLTVVLALGGVDAASARQKQKHRSARPAVTETARLPRTLTPVDRGGTPIIMQGYRSPRMMRDAGQPMPQPRLRESRAAAAPTFRRSIRRPLQSTARRLGR